LAPLTEGAIRDCPITLPDQKTVTNPAFGNYGNHFLTFHLPVDGKIIPAPNYWQADGSVGVKLGMFRRVEGTIAISGQRLDAPAPPPIGYYDVDGYGVIGFQSGGIEFPSEGCWEITASIGKGNITFVTIVMHT
jgi:hypothetical protein